MPAPQFKAEEEETLIAMWAEENWQKKLVYSTKNQKTVQWKKFSSAYNLAVRRDFSEQQVKKKVANLKQKYETLSKENSETGRSAEFGNAKVYATFQSVSHD